MRDDTYLQFINFLKCQQKFNKILPQTFDVQSCLEHKYPPSQRQAITAELANLDSNPITVLGLNFRHNLYTSAGMFKGTTGYEFVNGLKAGAFVFGTTTFNPREGNTKHGVKHPFVSLESSHVALNYLGLPNAGDEVISKHQFLNKDPNCPVIVSVMRSPDFAIDEATEKLVQSLWLYHENHTVDMIEINESCPNVNASNGSIDELSQRLRYIADNFLHKRSRHLPVVLKLSNMINHNQLRELTTLLIELQFDGIIVGNTVTNYDDYAPQITLQDTSLYNYFTEKFGGGLSGVVLKGTSLRNVEVVAEVVEQLKPNHEFAIIRCGGINTAQDLKDSDDYGVSLNQWYSGFIGNFLQDDVKTYVNMRK